MTHPPLTGHSWRWIGAIFVAALVWTDALSGRQAAIPQAGDRAVAHVLNRLTFGPRPGDLDRVRTLGVAAYIERQLHPERIDDGALETRLDEFETLGLSTRELTERYFAAAIEMRRQQAQQPQGRDAITPEMRRTLAAPQQVLSELMQAKLLRAAFSERQLQEVLVDFWFNHFNVFIGKGQVRQYLPEYERDVIRPQVLGNFRDLLGAVAHSPAMLIYLDNWQSAAPNTQMVNRGRIGMLQRPAPRRQARGLNENYARELMELHTLGVDGGYTQQDVVELARILTGWTIEGPRQGGGFLFRPAMHDSGTKTFLGTRFDGSGRDEGERALDLLARHRSTARHISYKLAQRFVADDPPTALVDRAARTFTDSGGNLREVVRTIITSPEFLSPEVYRAKVKTPLEFVVSSVRATGATMNSALPLVAAMRNLGMPLYGSQPPTGYSATSDAWVNTGALLNRMNFAVSLVEGSRMPAEPPVRRLVRARQTDARATLGVDLASLAPDTGESSRNAVIGRLLGGEVSASTRATLERAESPSHLVALTLGSPEFQRR
jgi:uncharacterized protein (DUF1800 family)